MHRICPKCYQLHETYYLETQFGKLNLVADCPRYKKVVQFKFEEGLPIPTKMSPRRKAQLQKQDIQSQSLSLNFDT